ncbi:MAG: PaaI family thioesterase [Oscillospiraceae bacterium]
MTKQEKLKLMNSRSGFNMHNGIVITDISDELCVVEGELKPQAMNPLGMAHGGFVYSLCDVAAGALMGQNGGKFVTLSSSMNYLRPSQGSRLRAEGRQVKKGRTVCVVETSVYDDQDRLTARGTFEIYNMK